MKKRLGFIYLIALCTTLQAQVVTYFPQYPTLQDSVEIIFNAAAGNAGLNGAAQVYMHTGTISDGKNVITEKIVKQASKF